MTPNQVRELGRSLTRGRLGLDSEVSDYRIARTIAPLLGVTPHAVEHWLSGRRQISGTAAILLGLLESKEG